MDVVEYPTAKYGEKNLLLHTICSYVSTLWQMATNTGCVPDMM